MSLGTWIVAGTLVGVVVSMLVIRSGEGLVRDIALGIAGAALAGALFDVAVVPDKAIMNVFGLVATFAGGCAALIVYHMLLPRIRAG
jgi:uncharacterized membrane protein YeaQ/YmgE (transglycosylase-associated protein family)